MLFIHLRFLTVNLLLIIFAALMPLGVYAGDTEQNTIQANGKGELIVYRKDQDSRRKGVYFNLYVNGQKIGKMKNKRAYQLTLPAGQYTLSSNGKAQSPFQIEVTAGGRVLVKAGIVKKRHYGMSFQRDKLENYAPEALKQLSVTLKE